MTSTDRTTFETLYRSNVRSVLAYVLTRTTRDSAPDVISSTFLVAWRRIDDVPADALPWLIGVARRVLAEQSRSQSRRSALERRVASEASTESRWSADVADQYALRGAVRAAFLGLRPLDRDVLTLVAWQGLNTEQLAVSLGCSRALASLRLHRARKRFGQLYADGQAEQAEGVRSQGAGVQTAKETP
jgi:RNA polymerase sigma-70 factor, ECF subfamily